MKSTIVVFALLLLGACTETRFEAPLGSKLESCDARIKGLWTGADPADRDAAILVDSACRFFIIDKPASDQAVRRIELPVRYAHVDGRDYISVEAAAFKALTELAPPYGIDPAPAQAYFFARYRIDGTRLEIEQPNSERVAQRVLANTIDGTVSKTHAELHVFVRGDAARMLEIVRSEPIFDGSPPTVLVRSKQSLKQFERALMQPPKKDNR